MVHASASARRQPNGTKPLFEVKPPPPFEKATVPARRDASETSPCRSTGDAKRCARPPQGDGGWEAKSRGDRDPRGFGATPADRVGDSS